MKCWTGRVLLYVFAFGISIFSAQAQEDEFAKLKAEMLAETEDTVLAANYARLSFSYVNIDIDSAYYYAKKCMSFSEDIDYRLGQALGYNLLSISYGARNMLDSAIIALLASLEIFEELNDSLGMANCYGNLGIIYDRTNQHDKAIEFGLKDLEIRIHSDDTLGIMNNLTNMINYHLNRDDLEGASTYYEMMKGVVEDEDGSKYHGMLVQAGAFIEYLKRDYRNSREHFIEAMAIWHPQRDYLEWGHASAYKGRCEFYLGMYDQAQQSIDTALKVYENVGSWMYHFEELLYMSRIDSALGDFESAYRWHSMYTERELDRLNAQKLVELSLMQDQFESSLKEAENKALTDQNIFQELIISRQRIIGVAIIVCLVVLGILAIYLLRVNIIIKQKSTILELQKEQIESQNAKLERLNEVKSKMISIISHDFRSPLVSVQSTMSILEQMGKSEHTFKQLLPELKSKVDYTAELVDNLLLWANDHLEDTQLNLEDFDLKPFIERKTIYF
jgi:two-component system, sensor histidine kinase and response regulator